MPRRKEEKPDIPEWVVTYGDLMSLLLCFFILLAAFSELKQEREYLDVVKSIQQAFGYESGIGRAPTDDIPTNTIIEHLEQLELKNKEQSSDRFSPNIQDQSTKSTYLTQGIKFTLGGALTFQPGSAELSEQAKATLREAANRIRGTRNKIEIRGHAHGFEDSRAGDDLYDLSYKRAKAAVTFLINECNVSSQILVPVPVADQEPAQVDPLGSPSGAEHRRVQIIQTEIGIDEVNPDAYGTGRQPAGADDN
jgi:chemotaxis protein MotB